MTFETDSQIETELEHSKRKREDATIHLIKSRGLVELAEQQRAEYFLDIDFGLSGTALSAWTRLSAAFDGLADTKRIWDITDDRRSDSEPIREVLESAESDVIHWLAFDSSWSAPCGHPNIAALRTATACVTRAI